MNLPKNVFCCASANTMAMQTFQWNKCLSLSLYWSLSFCYATFETLLLLISLFDIIWSLIFSLSLYPFFFCHLCSPSSFSPSPPPSSIIAARRKSLSRRRRSQTSRLRPASLRSTPITTLWRLRPPPPPSPMAPPFSPPLPWPGNWHAHRPSVHPARTMTCLSTCSRPLSRRSTINLMAWGTEATGSATAACISKIWTCQCLWTFQTTGNQTWPGRSRWGTCSHAAAASALMFSWVRFELVVSVCSDE